jgi:hypothetical protein
MAAIMAAPVPSVGAQAVIVPFGTQVGLQFVAPVDSSSVVAGTQVHFRVGADVVSDGRIVILRSTPAVGTVTQVTQPGILGRSSKVVTGYVRTVAADGSSVPLRDVVVSKAMVSNARVGAAGATVAGAIALGPVGLLAGALVRGGNARVPAGTVVTDTTDASARMITR